MIETSSEGFHPAYVIPVLLGLLLAVLFPSGRAILNEDARKRYRIVQLVTLVGAIIGAKFVAVIADLRWPLEPLPEEALFLTGRSITGALLFGFVTAQLAKRAFGYREPPNDRFATVLPFSIAIGRVGCLLAGCCYGIETDCPVALPDAHGMMRHPTALYDLMFHVALGGIFIMWLRQGRYRGRLFALHLVSYGVFRFLIEELRDSREYAWSMSGYQLISVLMIIVGVYALLKPLPPPSEPSSSKPGPRRARFSEHKSEMLS